MLFKIHIFTLKFWWESTGTNNVLSAVAPSVYFGEGKLNYGRDDNNLKAPSINNPEEFH